MASRCRTDRTSGAVAQDSSEDRRHRRCNLGGLKQIEFLDSTGMQASHDRKGVVRP
jgi:hypothetical protein